LQPFFPGVIVEKQGMKTFTTLTSNPKWYEIWP